MLWEKTKASNIEDKSRQELMYLESKDNPAICLKIPRSEVMKVETRPQFSMCFSISECLFINCFCSLSTMQGFQTHLGSTGLQESISICYDRRIGVFRGSCTNGTSLALCAQEGLNFMWQLCVHACVRGYHALFGSIENRFNSKRMKNPCLWMIGRP